MNCKKCGHKAVKTGTRPVRRVGSNKRVQAYMCTSPKCWYQWVDKEK
jgi:hypothetical protein